MNIQAPPNLSAGSLDDLIAAGINDWGGVSPVTPDHVNPEAPWPQLDALARATAAAGKRPGASGSRSIRRYVQAPDALARPRRSHTRVLRAIGRGGLRRAPTPGRRAPSSRCRRVDLPAIALAARAG